MTPTSSLSHYAFSDSFRVESGCLLGGLNQTQESTQALTASELVNRAEEDSNNRRALLVALPAEIIRREIIQAASSRSGINPFTKYLVDTFKEKGTALEVGCGVGLDSLALLRRGWSVYLVDKFPEVLELFKKFAKSGKPLPGKYQTLNKDITRMSLKQDNLDLVLAYDVLPYLPPSSLLSTVQKIYQALHPGGLFMGTFLANRELKTQEDLSLMAYACALGAYSYTDPAALTRLFQSQGFHLEVYAVSTFPEASHPGRIVSFIARKPV